MDNLKENICEGGDFHGREFNISTADTKIGYQNKGHYQKSAIKNEIEQTIWHWHAEEETN